MKKHLIYILCACAIVLTLFLRVEMYDIVEKREKIDGQGLAQRDDDASVSVHYHEKRPYYTSYGGSVHGLIADRVALVFSAADIPFHWVSTPANRQLALIENDEAPVCAVGWFKTPERQQYGKYTLPIYQDRPFVAIARADNDLLRERENLSRVLEESRLRLLIKSSYSYGRYIDEKIVALRPWKIETTADNFSMLEMIQAQRADYCFMTEEEAHDILLFSAVNRSDFKIIPFDDIPQGSKRYLICSRQFKDSDVDKLNAALGHFFNIPETE